MKLNRRSLFQMLLAAPAAAVAAARPALNIQNRCPWEFPKNPPLDGGYIVPPEFINDLCRAFSVPPHMLLSDPKAARARQIEREIAFSSYIYGQPNIHRP